MRTQLSKLQKLKKDPEWLKENKKLASVIIERSKQPFYQYEPYIKRDTNEPSWQWHYLLAAGKYKGRIALAANRTGKTKQAIYELILAILGQHPIRHFPQSGIAWMIALDFPMSTQVDLPIFEEFLPDHIKKAGKFHKQELLWEIKRPDGGEWLVYFKSTEAGREKFQGQKLDIAVYDEEPKKIEVFSEVERGLVDRGGVWWMAATPIMGTAWLKALSERKDVFPITASIYDNPYLPKEEIDSFAASLSEEERMVRIEGKYIIWGGKPVFDVLLLNRLRDQLSRGEQGFLRSLNLLQTSSEH